MDNTLERVGFETKGCELIMGMLDAIGGMFSRLLGGKPKNLDLEEIFGEPRKCSSLSKEHRAWLQQQLSRVRWENFYCCQSCRTITAWYSQPCKSCGGRLSLAETTFGRVGKTWVRKSAIDAVRKALAEQN